MSNEGQARLYKQDLDRHTLRYDTLGSIPCSMSRYGSWWFDVAAFMNIFRSSEGRAVVFAAHILRSSRDSAQNRVKSSFVIRLPSRSLLALLCCLPCVGARFAEATHGLFGTEAGGVGLWPPDR